jgi:hypothetical protein
MTRRKRKPEKKGSYKDHGGETEEKHLLRAEESRQKLFDTEVNVHIHRSA